MAYSTLTNGAAKSNDDKGSSKPAEQGLRILIAGAGIGGLVAAIALRQQGHEVLVGIGLDSCENLTNSILQLFEQSQFASELGAAIHLAPNANGILRRLGVFPEKFGANPMRQVCLRRANASCSCCNII